MPRNKGESRKARKLAEQAERDAEATKNMTPDEAAEWKENKAKERAERAAKAAAKACSGPGAAPFTGHPNTECGFSWTGQSYDGLAGGGEQMNSLSASMYVLITTLMLIQSAAMCQVFHVRCAGVVGARSLFHSGDSVTPSDSSTAATRLVGLVVLMEVVLSAAKHLAHRYSSQRRSQTLRPAQDDITPVSQARV